MDIQELARLYRKAAMNFPGGKCAVSTDTRTILPGQIYFALKGENFDGNAFAQDALDKGAAYAVVSNTTDLSGPKFIRVPDTLKTLQELAMVHRDYRYSDVIGSRLKGVIAITGTNGKTTTKEMLKAALGSHFCVIATEGNLNNDIGVPLTLLRIHPDVDYAIVEMGASHPDDLKPLLAMAKPTYGIITNVGRAHLQGFGSFEGVKYAKGLMYDYLAEHNGTAFVNWDDEILREMVQARPGLKVVKYGLKEKGYSILPKDAQHPYLGIDIGDYKMHTHLVGDYNAANVLCGLTVGRYIGSADFEAIPEMEAYIPSNSRSQFTPKGSNFLIEDAYNANPSSMGVALDNLQAMEHPRKVAMLGEMRELGPDSVALHKEVLDKALSLSLAEIYLVGQEFIKAAEGVSGVRTFETSDALAEYVKANPPQDSLILIKGSRGTRMEKVIASL